MSSPVPQDDYPDPQPGPDGDPARGEATPHEIDAAESEPDGREMSADHAREPRRDDTAGDRDTPSGDEEHGGAREPRGNEGAGGAHVRQVSEPAEDDGGSFTINLWPDRHQARSAHDDGDDAGIGDRPAVGPERGRSQHSEAGPVDEPRAEGPARAQAPSGGTEAAAGGPGGSPEVELGRPEARRDRRDPHDRRDGGAGAGEAPRGPARPSGADVRGSEEDVSRPGPVTGRRDSGQDSTGEMSTDQPTMPAAGTAAEQTAPPSEHRSPGLRGNGATGAGAGGTGAGTTTPATDDATQQLEGRGDPTERRRPSERPDPSTRHEDTAAMAAPIQPAEPAAAQATPPAARPAEPSARAAEPSARAASTQRQAPVRSAPQRGTRRVLRRHATVRRIDPWSVLKLSLLFYFCLLLVVMLGLTVFWTVVNQLGLINQLLGFLQDLQLVVAIDGGMIAQAIFLIGLLNVVLWSGINVFLAFLYNLVADLVGGLRITLAEDQQS